MKLTINWNATIPDPACGYKVTYRKKDDLFYQTVNVPNPTPGPPLEIQTFVEGAYEGYVSADCCRTEGKPYPWGANCWNKINVQVTEEQTEGKEPHYRASVSLEYSLLYSVEVTGTYSVNCGGQLYSFPFTLTIQAGAVSASAVVVDGSGNTIYAPCTGGTISNIQATGRVIFPGGILHDHCKPYYGSIPVWNNCPTSLPSYTMAYDPSAQTLTASWIQESNPVTTCGNWIMEVHDGSGTLIGSIQVGTGGIGYRKAVINLSGTIPTGTYNVQFRWSNGCVPCNQLAFGI